MKKADKLLLFEDIKFEDFKQFYLTHTRAETCVYFNMEVAVLKEYCRLHNWHKTDIKKETIDEAITAYINGYSLTEIYTNFHITANRFIKILSANKITLRSKEEDEKIRQNKIKQTKLERYGDPTFTNREKFKTTCIEKYGTTNVFAVNEVKEKIKETCLEHFGVEYAAQAEVVKEKIKNTCLDRYNSSFYLNSNAGKEKIKKINLEKFDCENPWSNKEVIEQIKITNLSKYGETTYTKTKKYKEYMKEIQKDQIKKINITKEKHNTFNSSKPENEFYDFLLTIFDISDVVRNYSLDERYPFSCDFYIKSLDLFIELNLSWTHGGKKFDESDEEDKAKLEKWKNKNTKYYNNAINTWTVRDIKKFEIANKNNLNYIVFYNIDEINEFKQSKCFKKYEVKKW